MVRAIDLPNDPNHTYITHWSFFLCYMVFVIIWTHSALSIGPISSFNNPFLCSKDTLYISATIQYYTHTYMYVNINNHTNRIMVVVVAACVSGINLAACLLIKDC